MRISICNTRALLVTRSAEPLQNAVTYLTPAMRLLAIIAYVRI